MNDSKIMQAFAPDDGRPVSPGAAADALVAVAAGIGLQTNTLTISYWGGTGRPQRIGWHLYEGDTVVPLARVTAELLPLLGCDTWEVEDLNVPGGDRRIVTVVGALPDLDINVVIFALSRNAS
jgi:hypothetical protein